MEILIALIIIAVFLYVMISSRKSGLNKAESELDLAKEEKEAWSEERFVSYGQVQKTREDLKNSIETSFTGSEEHRSLIIEIVNEWADLRVKTFEERRSWVRSPKNKK
tara:strand:- start:4997 stop:5320 length:324 start_codon:yes stop_codon:yes gene_type:complete